MGPTGSGKTNVSESVIASNVRTKNAQFINTLTGNAEKSKASGHSSATQNVTEYTIMYRGLRLVLVDTPSFGDTRRSDMETLRITADWLTKKYVTAQAVCYSPEVTYTKVPRRPHPQTHWDNLPPPDH